MKVNLSWCWLLSFLVLFSDVTAQAFGAANDAGGATDVLKTIGLPSGPAKPAGETVAQTEALKQDFIASLRAVVERDHASLQREIDAGNDLRRNARGFLYTLTAMVSLHITTGEETFLNWAEQDLAAIAASMRGPDGRYQPALASFRYLQPLCEAYMYLKDHGRLSPEARIHVEGQIQANMPMHLAQTDFGPHNRGSVDAAAFLYAAAAMPKAPDANRWLKYGQALLYDSWGSGRSKMRLSTSCSGFSS